MSPRRLPTLRPAAFPHLASLVAVLVLGGCSVVNTPADGPAPEPAPEPEPVAREFGGQLSVAGAQLPVVLSLVVRGEDVEEALLTVPELGMEARGHGHLRGGRLELELDYGDDCDGEARVEGDVEDGGYAFRGILEARDCTGREEGALVLRLRPEDGPAGRTRPFLVESAPSGA